jgi:hypothetical protein
MADPTPLLCEQLGGKRAERESDHGICGGVMQSSATGNVLDRVVADTARVCHAIVQPSEHLARVHVGCVDCVADRAEAFDKGAQSIGQALRVMEEQDLGHVSSVRLSARVRDQRGGFSCERCMDTLW